MRTHLVPAVLAVIALTGCSLIGADEPEGRTVQLLVHDSFAMDEAVIAEFQRSSGITLDVQRRGDAGQLTNELVLTVDDPLGDVAYGVDSTFASRALEAGVFQPYRPDVPGIERYALDGTGRLSAVDVGDVCVNADPAALAARGLPEPATFDDLADPRYRDLLVVEDPATSSPGLAFLLATVDRYGESGWQDYWARLRDNGVQVVSGWEEAYTVEFSGSSGAGPRPLVVSYASSPAAEIGEDGQPRTRALLDTCNRQVEYAGILAGTDAPDDARAVVDFLLSRPFQAQVSEQMFRLPRARRRAAARVLGDGGAAAGGPRVAALGPRAGRTGAVGGAVALDRAVTGRRLPVVLATAVPVAFLGLLFGWPVAAMLRLGLAEGGVADVLADAGTWELVAFTLGQAAASTVLTVLAGMPVAWLLARVQLPGRWLLRVAVTVPFVLPTVVIGVAFRALVGEGLLAILLAHVFFNTAVVARTVAGLWAHTDRRAEDAARALGAPPWRAFTAVTLPALAPALASAAAVVFLFCATSFGVVLILGGGRYRTLETEIYLQTVNLLDLRTAAALSLLQLAAVLAVLAVGARARRRREGALALRPVAETARPPHGRQRWLVALALGVLAAQAVPVLALLLRSVTGRDGWTLAAYRAMAGPSDTLPVSVGEAALTSLRTATDATLLALVVGVVSAAVLARAGRGAGALDAALMLPLGVSAVTVGFGYLVTLGSLRSSAFLVPLVQALIAIPLVVRTVLPVLRAVDVRLRQAAATLGAPPWRVWREVDLPLAGRAVLAAAGFAFVIALGEFGATSFLAHSEPTLPVAVARLIGRPGELNTQLAYAASAVLVVLTVAVVALVERVRVAEIGEF